MTQPDAAVHDEVDPASQPTGRVTAPAASTVRFVLLIAAVVASTALIFLDVQAALPGHYELFEKTVLQCALEYKSDPAYTGAVDDAAAFEVMGRRMEACLGPVLLDQGALVAAGIGIVFLAAVVLYLLHPWWIIRRRKLKRLSAATSPKLVAQLEQLRQEIGLSRSPDWRLAPFARTVGGQAFGLPWHRYVQIDAGLVVLHASNRPAFRAVVLHELAHLRNRDVDKTYLTISLWRSFVVFSLLPFLAGKIQPELYRTPLQWTWRSMAFVTDPVRQVYVFSSLAMLVGLVYLTRNAILRTRETHADAVAAAHDGRDTALPALLERLPEPTPRWLRRWGTHPLPGDRIAAVKDPRLLLTPGLWELFGVAITTAVVCLNTSLVVGPYFLAGVFLPIAVIGLVVGPLAISLLAVSLWRVVARDPVTAPSLRHWLIPAPVLVAGYLVGTFASLRYAATGRSLVVDPWLLAVSMLLLGLGTTLVAAWLASAARGVLTLPDRPRWAMPAVIAAAVGVGATWFALWLPLSQGTNSFTPTWGPPPATGADIGWYAQLSAWTGADFYPLYRMVHNPLTLTTLTLLWLVPVLAGRRSRVRRLTSPGYEPIAVGSALRAGAVGGLVVAVLGAVLPYLANAALPAAVRRTPDDPDLPGSPFYVVYENTFIYIGALAVAIVMAVMVARRGPHRPTLALLAGVLTSALSIVVLYFVSYPTACYAATFQVTPRPTNCFAVPRLIGVSQLMHWVLLFGLVVAIPAMLVALTAGAIFRRGRPREVSRAPATPSRLCTTVTVITLLLLVTVSIGASWFSLSRAYTVWLSQNFG